MNFNWGVFWAVLAALVVAPYVSYFVGRILEKLGI
jgi:hypothetical protein